MQRVSTAIENQRAGGSKFSFAPGLGEVTDATVAVEHLGTWSAVGYRLTIQRLGKDMKANDDEPVTQFLPVGNTSTRDGEALFHPGKADGPDDESPEDLGDENDTEGNVLLAAGDLKLDLSLGGQVFTRSLQEHGFKAVLLNGYMPNLIGMKAEFDQLELKKKEGATRAPTALIVKKILHFPYDDKKAASASTSAKPAAGKSTKPSAAKEVEAPESSEAAEKAGECAEKIGEVFAGQSVTRKKIGARLLMLFPKVKAATKDYKAIQAMFADDDWFSAQAEARGWEVDGDDVAIPAAE